MGKGAGFPPQNATWRKLTPLKRYARSRQVAFLGGDKGKSTGLAVKCDLAQDKPLVGVNIGIHFSGGHSNPYF